MRQHEYVVAFSDYTVVKVRADCPRKGVILAQARQVQAEKSVNVTCVKDENDNPLRATRRWANRN